MILGALVFVLLVMAGLWAYGRFFGGCGCGQKV
jgi:hypothetical protein